MYNEGLGDNIEFKTYAGPNKGGNTTTVKSNHCAKRPGGGSYSYDSGSESEEQLVKGGGGKTIQVTKSIQQQRS